MTVCSHPLKHPLSDSRCALSVWDFISLLRFPCSSVLLEVILGQAEVAVLAYLIFVMVMTSKQLPAWLTQYRVMKSDNLIMVFCTSFCFLGHMPKVQCMSEWLGLRVNVYFTKKIVALTCSFFIIQCLVIEILKGKLYLVLYPCFYSESLDKYHSGNPYK